MKIGILGTGAVGGAIGHGFIALGHEVKLGAREPGNTNAAEWAMVEGPNASAGTFAEAAEFGEIVVLATLGTAIASALRAAEPKHLAGKIVIDATNPLEFSTGGPQLTVGFTDSAGEQAQRLLPGSKVVKAFNTVGNTLMFRPQLPGGPPDMFIAGNDDHAKQKVAEILKDFGWGVADLGGIESSRYLEAMCMAWCMYGARSGTWNHAFKLLRK